jgi:hypothetical protein
MRDNASNKSEYIIDKKRGVRHLLHAAIRMTLEGEDALGINMLAQATDKVLLDLLKHAEIQDPMLLEERIVPERRNEFFRIYRQSFNFLKHANEDPKEKLPIGNILVTNEMLLFANIARYRKLFSEFTVHMQKHLTLVTLLHPRLIRWKDMGEKGEQFLKDRRTFEHMTRRECISLIKDHAYNDGGFLRERSEDLELVTETNHRRLNGEAGPERFRLPIE